MPDFSEADLTGTNLSGADLSEANLSVAIFRIRWLVQVLRRIVERTENRCGNMALLCDRLHNKQDTPRGQFRCFLDRLHVQADLSAVLRLA
jgi:uncharacterized protein YjbI with pentapeptide repeats